MRDLKKYVWVLPFLGVIICTVSLFTPAASFENIIWNHEIVIWIWGYFQDTFNLTVSPGFHAYPIQLVPSIVTSLIILISIIIITIELIKHRNDLKKGSIKHLNYILPAIIIICITIFWMVEMEAAEQAIYDISMWSRYVPGFGLIGLFTGACFIIFRSFLTKYIKAREI